MFLCLGDSPFAATVHPAGPGREACGHGHGRVQRAASQEVRIGLHPWCLVLRLRLPPPDEKKKAPVRLVPGRSRFSGPLLDLRESETGVMREMLGVRSIRVCVRVSGAPSSQQGLGPQPPDLLLPRPWVTAGPWAEEAGVVTQARRLWGVLLLSFAFS